MNAADIRKHRLVNQQIAATKFTKPQEIISWLGAMQAQEYAMAKWAIGLRLQGVRDADIEQAIAEGKILRTHLMRPTWHFVAPEDIRWLTKLTAPRVNLFLSSMNRKMGVDEKILKKATDIIEKTLEGGKHRTREHIKSELNKKKIRTDDFRAAHIMMHAEMEGIVCNGAREGKQHTYALLDERVASTKKLSNDEALAKLVNQYFESRSPATIQDFVWWCGLTVTDARKGVTLLSKHFKRTIVDGKEYIYSEKTADTPLDKNAQTSFLMPDYDEYGISYKDRSAIICSVDMSAVKRGGNPVFNRMIIINGVIEGTWNRVLKNKTVTVQTFPFTKLSKHKEKAMIEAVKKFAAFTTDKK